MRIGSRRPLRFAITSAKAFAVPGWIRPSADSPSGQFGLQAASALVTRTKRIGGAMRGRARGLKSAYDGRASRPESAKTSAWATRVRRCLPILIHSTGGRFSAIGAIRFPRMAPALRRGPSAFRVFADPFALQALVFEGDDARAVLALQAPDDEMPAGQGLEMIGEGGVDRRAADRAQDRRGLGGDLLAHHNAKARGDLRNQPRDHGRGKGGDPLSGDKARAVGDGLGERGPNREITALERRFPIPPAAEGEHFNAGEGRFGNA